MELMLEQSGVTGHVFNTVGSVSERRHARLCHVRRGETRPPPDDGLARRRTGRQDPGLQLAASSPDRSSAHFIPGMVFTDLLLKDSTPEL